MYPARLLHADAVLHRAGVDICLPLVIKPIALLAVRVAGAVCLTRRKVCVFISKKEPCAAMFLGIEKIILGAIKLGEEKRIIPLFWCSCTGEDSAVCIHGEAARGAARLSQRPGVENRFGPASAGGRQFPDGWTAVAAEAIVGSRTVHVSG